MTLPHVAGEEFFPEKAHKFATKELPDTFVKFLQANKLVPSKKPSRLDLLKILKQITAWQEAQSKEKMGPQRGKPTNKGAPVRSPGLLQEVRYSVTDFLMDTFGPRPFVPVRKKGRDLWITLGWAETNFVRTWVSVVDSDHRDISDWNRQRVTNREGTYTAALAKEFHRLTKDRAQVIRMWLPALSLPILFTRDGVNPNAGMTPVRSRYRELRCYALQKLWDALGIEGK